MSLSRGQHLVHSNSHRTLTMVVTEAKIVVRRGRLETVVVERGIRAVAVHWLQRHPSNVISHSSSSSSNNNNNNNNVVGRRLSVNSETTDIQQKHL